MQPYLADLLRRSNARVATNQDFNYVREDIAEIEKSQTNQTVTLNEREAIKERQKNTARDKAREAERAARSLPELTTYDITVENADQPGLTVHAEPGETNVTTTSFVDTNAIEKVIAVLDSTNSANGTNEAALLAAKLLTQTNKLALDFTNKPVLDLNQTPTVPTTIQTTAAGKKLPPPFDPVFDEARSILQDYISILPKSGSLIADH